jgi:putative DNA primase/helicase
MCIWRRIHYIPYNYTIPEKDRDTNFEEKVLFNELPGILNWMLDGLKDYLQNGIGAPDIVCSATKEYRNDLDVIGQWIDAFCVKAEKSERLSVIYGEFKKWIVDEYGWPKIPSNRVVAYPVVPGSPISSAFLVSEG